MERDFFKRLRVMTNMTNATTSDMKDVCTYLYWAFVNQLDIKFANQLTSEDRERIYLMANTDVYEKYDAHPELIYLPTYQLFR